MDDGTTLVRIDPRDNVAVALSDIPVGAAVVVDGMRLVAASDIGRGHKIALRRIGAGEMVVKYGNPIGHATCDIAAGDWVHTHNLATNLDQTTSYAYEPTRWQAVGGPPVTFDGYRRADGRVATRNEIWIIPTVGCVNATASRIAAQSQGLVGDGIDAVVALPHPYGCSQMGDDLRQTRRLLAALARHPNAAGVLLLGLGCEENDAAGLFAAVGETDGHVRSLVSQTSPDEVGEGVAIVAELAAGARGFRRQAIDVSELVVGMKCGGSDGMSGITANPCVGRVTDRLVGLGGRVLLTEVPEMFGGETILFNRAADERVFRDAVDMIERFKDYFRRHGQVVYDNPSPGNKAGGITTLEEKSCGCVLKGGHAPVTDVIGYAGQVRRPGLTLLESPSNDIVSTTALAAAGAHLVLFTTGRGTPFGGPVPTVKISSNTQLAKAKPSWIDFDAGTIAGGEPIATAGDRLFDLVIETASGRPARNETNGHRAIAIFSDGVTM